MLGKENEGVRKNDTVQKCEVKSKVSTQYLFSSLTHLDLMCNVTGKIYKQTEQKCLHNDGTLTFLNLWKILPPVVPWES